MLRKLFGLACLGVAVVGAHATPAAAEMVEEAPVERVSILQEDTVGADTDNAVTAAPVVEGVFSFQPLNTVEDASADASEEPFTILNVTKAADADVSKEANSFSTPSDVVGAISPDANVRIPQNNIVSTNGLERGTPERRPVAVLAGAKTIPRPRAEGLTPREVQRLESFDDIWTRFKRQQVESLEQTNVGASHLEQEEPETPTVVEVNPEAETPSVPEPNVDAETPQKQEEAHPAVSTEENPAAQVEELTGEQTEEETAFPSEQTGVETKKQEETTPSTPQTEAGALETQEETAPTSAEGIGETPSEMTMTLGVSGVGGDEAALEASLGFVQGDFEVTAASSSPLSEEGLTVVDLATTVSISENTSVRLAANNVTSETETTFDVGIETQVLPDLTLGATFEDLDDVKVNLDATWQATDTVAVALGVDDITTEKVVNVEGTYADPGELFAVTARANDILRPATRSFDLDASYKVNAWVSSSLSISATPDPTVGIGAAFQLNRNTSLNLSAADIFGEQTYGAEIEFTF